MLTEASLKGFLIDKLFERGEVLSDAVLISEMVVDGWSRRADVVLANGKLSAFEVKSDLDSLIRLPGQLETYRAFFERVVVVVGPRLADKVTALAPDGVGVWVAEGSETVVMRERRRARTFELTRDAALTLMTVSDIRRLLSANGITSPARAARRELEDIARSLTRRDLAAAARNAVKLRYRARHKRFLASRKRCGTLAALGSLKRPNRNAAILEVSLPSEVTLPRYSASMDHPLAVLTPAGPILKRLRHSNSSGSASS